jgi:predicted ATPase
MTVSEKANLYEIALTGGPNGGKSTFSSACRRTLEEKGWKVITPSEAATKTLASGIHYLDPEIPNIVFQTIMINQMLIDRKNALLAAKHYNDHGRNVLILYDRGLCDNKAYCSPEDWQKLLKDNNLVDEKLRQMYHAVFNIVTTAYGAEDVWENLRGNNPERYEQTVEQARATEDRTQSAWAGHYNLKIFGNDESGWEGKEKRLFDAAYSTIGITPPVRMDNRYLVDIPADLENFSLQHNCVVQPIEQTYLQSKIPNVERRIRRITNGNDVAYYYTEREKRGQSLLTRREYMPRNEREYLRLLDQADPSKKTVTKTRYAFTNNNQHLILDVYPQDAHPQLGGKAILELKEIEKMGQELVVPQGLAGLEDITNDDRFAIVSLAAKKQGRICMPVL